MDQDEIDRRKKGREAAIMYLESFIPDGEESQYGVYTYSELLYAVRLQVSVELARLNYASDSGSD